MIIKGQTELDMYVMGNNSYIAVSLTDDLVFAIRDGGEQLTLGVYPSSKRAIEVLNELFFAYAEGAKAFKMPEE